MEKFVDILIEISIYSAVITACILLFRLLFKKRISPKVQYTVWMLLVLRLMMPVTIESGFHMESLLPERPASFVEQESIFETETPVINLAPSDHAQADSPLVLNETVPAVSQETPEPTSVRNINWRLIAFWIWAAGAMGFGLWMMIVKLRFYADMQRHITSVSPQVYAIYAECCNALQVKPITMWTVDRSISPGIAFFSGPVLLLPASMDGNEDSLRYAFLHELTHKKRYDHYMTALLTVLRVVYWFNPAVHFGFNEMRADMETACDADVIAFVGKQQKRGYLNTIIELFSYATRPQLGMSQASSRRMAKRRMKGAFMRERTTIFGRAAALTLALVMLLGCFTTACQSAPPVKAEESITEAPNNLQSTDPYGQENETTTPEFTNTLSEAKIDLDGDGLADTVTMENRSPSDTNISPEEAKVILTVDLGKGTEISHEIPGWWWPENCCTADFDSDGKTDIALMLGAGGSNYGAAKVFVYRLESEQLMEYPENMIRNDAISYDQSMFIMLNDANWVSGGTVITEGQKSMLRLRHLLDYDPGAGITTAYYTNLSWKDNGWFVESMEIGEAYGEEQVSPDTLQPILTLSPEQTSLQNAILRLYVQADQIWAQGFEAKVDTTFYQKAEALAQTMGLSIIGAGKSVSKAQPGCTVEIPDADCSDDLCYMYAAVMFAAVPNLYDVSIGNTDYFTYHYHRVEDYERFLTSAVGKTITREEAEKFYSGLTDPLETYGRSGDGIRALLHTIAKLSGMDLAAAELIQGTQPNASLRPTPTPQLQPTPIPTPTPAPTASMIPDAYNPPTPIAGRTARATVDVNIRSGPGTHYDKIGQLKKGEVVPQIGTVNEWIKIHWDGQTAYVHEDYCILNSQEQERVSSLANALDQSGYFKKNANIYLGMFGDPLSGGFYIRVSGGANVERITGELSVLLADEPGTFKVMASSLPSYVNEAYIEELMNSISQRVDSLSAADKALCGFNAMYYDPAKDQFIVELLDMDDTKIANFRQLVSSWEYITFVSGNAIAIPMT